jgi:hypothetical protein
MCANRAVYKPGVYAAALRVCVYFEKYGETIMRTVSQDASIHYPVQLLYKLVQSMRRDEDQDRINCSLFLEREKKQGCPPGVRGYIDKDDNVYFEENRG